MKYVVVTGGVVSGLGKGISISSLGVILKSCGLNVTAIKIDPYLNSDAGHMSPYEHGEVYVLNDGGECDLDLGNYERFLDISVSREHNITTGYVYSKVIEAERRGDYKGKTVQVIPHVTDVIQDWIIRASAQPVSSYVTKDKCKPDICLIEVGGTVGDIESLVFLEALRQFQFRVGQENICFIHLSLVPLVGSDEEQKTKPTQHTVKELRSVGLNPNVILCRSKSPLHQSTKNKIANFCQVPPHHVLSVHDVSNIYHVPLLLEMQGASKIILEHFKLPHKVPDLSSWSALADVVDTVDEEVCIALVGKYVGMQDSYLSAINALQHAAYAARKKLVLEWIDASALEPSGKEIDEEAYELSWSNLKRASGIIVPGGFGSRGVYGKILAARYARENKVPYFGISLGMHCAVVELANAHGHIDDKELQQFVEEGTCSLFVPANPDSNPSATTINGHIPREPMKLGAHPAILTSIPGHSPSLAQCVYGMNVEGVFERFRHRVEIPVEKLADLKQHSLLVSGTCEEDSIASIIELAEEVHPFFLGAQFHPEFQSRFHFPAPTIHGFVLASAGLYQPRIPLAPAPMAHMSKEQLLTPRDD